MDEDIKNLLQLDLQWEETSEEKTKSNNIIKYIINIHQVIIYLFNMTWRNMRLKVDPNFSGATISPLQFGIDSRPDVPKTAEAYTIK